MTGPATDTARRRGVGAGPRPGDRRGPGHDRRRRRAGRVPRARRRTARGRRSTTAARTRAGRSATASSRTATSSARGTPTSTTRPPGRRRPGSATLPRRTPSGGPATGVLEIEVPLVVPTGQLDGPGRRRADRLGPRRRASGWSATPTSAWPTRCAGPAEDGRLTYVGIRHEGAAAFAASGYAKLTGRPAACFSIAGPGATNLMTGPLGRQGRPGPDPRPHRPGADPGDRARRRSRSCRSTRPSDRSPSGARPSSRRATPPSSRRWP